jgi:hypothetical protein
MSLSFGSSAGLTDDVLSRAHSAFLKRDPNAPLYLSDEEWAEFEKRDDLRNLRASYKEQKNSQSREAKRIQGKIQHIRNRLGEMQLVRKRRAYFDEVHRLRLEGKSTAHLQSPLSKDPRRKMHAEGSRFAQGIGAFFSHESPPLELIPTKLVAYLNFEFAEPDESDEPPADVVAEPPRSRCLFGCSGPFYNRSSLSRHTWNAHADEFDEPFPCPECRLLGDMKPEVIRGAMHWSHHVERLHGKLHAPAWETERTAYCPFCEHLYTPRGFSGHLKRHIKQGDFSGDFECPECQRAGAEQEAKTLIRGPEEWLTHVKMAHSGSTEVEGAITDRTYLASDHRRKRKHANEPDTPRKKGNLSVIPMFEVDRLYEDMARELQD